MDDQAQILSAEFDETGNVRAPYSLGAIHLDALTLELAIYGALALVALGIRLFLLDIAPLSSVEAQQAISAWSFINGRPFDSTGSPLLFAADSLLFLLGGAHDGAVRLVPALFGAALVLIPYLLRRDLGQVGALISSVLLTFSPGLVFFSRMGTGPVIAVTCSAAALAFGWLYLRDKSARALYSASFAAALALLSSREAWTIVLGSLVFLLIAWSRARRKKTGTEANHSVGPIGFRHTRVALVTFILVYLGVSTVFFFNRQGAGGAFDLFGQWLGGLWVGGSPFDLFRLLMVYEPLALLAGLAAMFRLVFDNALVRRMTPVPSFLAISAIVTFFVYSLTADPDPARLIVVTVPLIFLVGWYLGDWLSDLRSDLEEEISPASVLSSQYAPVFLFALVLAAFLYLVFAEFSTRGSMLAADVVAAITRMPASQGLNSLVLVGLVAIVAAAVGFLAVSTLGWLRAKHVAIAVLLAILLLWAIRQTALTSFSGDWNPREWLVADLQNVSRWRANDTHAIAILADESLGPVARWYLRSFRNVRFARYPSMSPVSEAYVARPDAPVNLGGLISQRYHLEIARSPYPDFDFLQWFLFRNSGAVVYSDAVVWLVQSE